MSSLLLPQSGSIPFAQQTEMSSRFWDGCRRGELLFQYFPASGRAQFPPARSDRASFGDAFEWRRSAGRGRVYSWSTVHRAPSPVFHTPYVVAIVCLEEGFEMISNIIGCRPEDVVEGLEVEVVFHAVNDDVTLPYFAPIAGPGHD